MDLGNEKDQAEELVLRNTYLNAQKIKPDPPKEKINNIPKVRWIDENNNQSLITIISRTKSSRGGTRPKKRTTSQIKPIIKKSQGEDFKPIAVQKTVKFEEYKNDETPIKSKNENHSTADFLDELEDINKPEISPPKFSPPGKRPEFPKNAKQIFAINRMSGAPETKILTTLGQVKAMPLIFNSKDVKLINGISKNPSSAEVFF